MGVVRIGWEVMLLVASHLAQLQEEAFSLNCIQAVSAHVTAGGDKLTKVCIYRRPATEKGKSAQLVRYLQDLVTKNARMLMVRTSFPQKSIGPSGYRQDGYLGTN
ncbi:unnamed protein product [Echinostoma caproni]|uniref:UPF0029 domain-containing protein n=1 Tax=Echinostoma caproni TaxID=27848 RepID=A0A183B359_9TREM|nr:unnamed protein product [Echinostoma caproni]